MLFSSSTRRIGALAALGLVAGLVACSATSADQPGEAGGNGADSGGNSSSTADPTFPEVPAAVELLPADIAERGEIRVAIPTNEPPTQYYREGTQEMTGINPDIARLLAGALGLELVIEVTNFDSIIPGIEADRYDLTVSSMTPTEERMQVLDFVEYVNVGNGLISQAGNPQAIGFDSLCGKRVAVLTGSYQLTVNVPELNAACEVAGEDPLNIQQFQDTRQAISSLVSDRSDAVYADGPIVSYAALQTPDIELIGEDEVAPVGIGIARDNGMLDAVKTALDAIIVSDEYLSVLGTYGVESMAITDAKVNVPQ